jgi:hypothetical protein
MKLVAVKLKLGQVADWVDHELNGYPTGDVPAYRMLVGQPKALNPYRGWIPMSGPAEFMEAISRRPVSQSVSSLEALLNSGGDGTLHFPFSPQQVEGLNRAAGDGLQWAEMGLHVDQSRIVAMLDAVRGKVLDWALELERAGIIGTEVGFSPEDERRAAGVSIQIGSFSGNFNSGDLTGANSRITMGGSDSSHNSASINLFRDLREAIEEIPPAAREPVRAAVDAMEQQAGKPGFLTAYQTFMGSVADHMTVVAPFLPQLAGLLSA